jgi:hypothetical protein
MIGSEVGLAGMTPFGLELKRRWEEFFWLLCFPVFIQVLFYIRPVKQNVDPNNDHE